MKLKLAIPGLLIALLVGCNDTTTVAPTVSPSAAANPTSNPVISEKISTPTATPTPVASKPTLTPTNSPNPFESDSFPKAGCGDRMPTDNKTDTIKLYPVFVDYSDSNLKTIKANYCGDALKITTKDKGKYVIQVASFTDEKRVNQFKEFLARKLGNTSVEVGEATVIGGKPIPKSTKQVASFTSEERANQFKQFIATNLGGAEVGVPNVRATKPKPQPTKDTVAKAAQLTPQQLEQLKNIIFKDSLGKLHKVEAILPTYLPPGFKLDSLKLGVSPEDPYGYGLKYEISYKNASNDSFKITTVAPGPGAGPPPYAPKLKAVNSPAFGEVIIGYKEFDKTSDKSSIEVIISAYPPEASNISENTPSDGGSSTWNYHLHSDTLSLAEATKIVESLSYLYPDEPRNLMFSNDLSNDPEWAQQ